MNEEIEDLLEEIEYSNQIIKEAESLLVKHQNYIVRLKDKIHDLKLKEKRENIAKTLAKWPISK